MSKLKLKVGDLVIMRDTSSYKEGYGNPRNTIGVVDAISQGTYDVMWGGDVHNGTYTDIDIELATLVNPTIQESIDSLILLEEVESAHKGESANWFKSLLHLVQEDPETIDFFTRYEAAYKEKTGVTTMPTSYRTAKSCIVNAINEHIELGADGLMSKSAIEKAVKDKRSKTTEPTPEELLGTIINACDSIRLNLKEFDIGTPEHTQAILYIQASLGVKVDDD